VFVARAAPRDWAATSDQMLHAFPRFGRNNGCMLAGVNLSLMPDRTLIYNVGQQPEQGIPRKLATRAKLAILTGPALEPPAPPPNLRERRQDRAVLLEKRRDGPHTFGLLRVHHEPSTPGSTS
jgi:hypothetical protein